MARRPAPERRPILPVRIAERAVKSVLKAVGGAVYYAIYRRFPDPKADPYWAEMHPDDDKGTDQTRGPFYQAPPSI